MYRKINNLKTVFQWRTTGNRIQFQACAGVPTNDKTQEIYVKYI